MTNLKYSYIITKDSTIKGNTVPDLVKYDETIIVKVIDLHNHLYLCFL